MRLPRIEELKNDDHRMLYRFDLKELHCADPYVSGLGKISRISKVVELVRKLVSDGSCLDIGCAQGNYALLLAENGYPSVGVDINPNFLTYALMKRENGHSDFICASADSLPFADKRFDVVILGEILEHAALPHRLLAEATRCLADSGYLFITSPNGERLRNRLVSYRQARDQVETLKGKQFGPTGDAHLFAFTLGEICELVSGVGLKILKASYIRTLLLNRAHYLRMLHLNLRTFLLLDEFLCSVPGVAAKLADTLLLVACKR